MVVMRREAWPAPRRSIAQAPAKSSDAL